MSPCILPRYEPLRFCREDKDKMRDEAMLQGASALPCHYPRGLDRYPWFMYASRSYLFELLFSLQHQSIHAVIFRYDLRARH